MLKFTAVFLACCALVNAAFVQPSPQAAKLEHGLADTFMNHMDSFKTSPQKTTECFGTFVPQMEAATEKYKTDVETCNSAAEAARLDVDKQVTDKRDSLASDIAGLCASFNTCNSNANALAFFECYSTSGTEASRTSSSVSYKANDGIQFVNIRYQQVESTKNVCVNTAADTYDSKYSQLSSELDQCLKG